jgi:hypothetical protein
MKTLYFEGVGSVPLGDVGNCRILTAFHNDKGWPIYLEFMGSKDPKLPKKRSPNFHGLGTNASIRGCHLIGSEKEPEKQIGSTSVVGANRLNYTKKPFEYSKAAILKFVNSLPHCSFDEIAILPRLAGYHAFDDPPGTSPNFADEFHYDKALTARREAIEKYYYDLEKSEGKQSPNISAWVGYETPPLLHILRYFDGYSKHWLINAAFDDWQATIQEGK